MMKPSLALAALLLPLGAAAAPITNFDSPPVVDLAGQLRAQAHGARAVAVQQLDAASGDGILRAAADTRQRLNPMESPQNDAKALAAHAGLAQRKGPLLTVSAGNGSRLQFKNWRTSQGDGDSSAFAYQGPLAGGALQRVDLWFGHDAPGSLLIDNRDGKVYFTYSTENIVAPAPDGKALLQAQTESDWRLQLSPLPQSGQGGLFCSLRRDSGASTVFKSWQGDAVGLELEQGGQRVALRIARDGGAWRVAASQPAMLARLGLRCSLPR
ncbi:hypothetical protein ACPRNU_16505 [Chromobacterium vaccinii]|uniref:hypothetical protein n=1 Tax=Chromobacterium vaccinii TaxID=1108595 RepID=UPI003C752EB9